MFSFQVAAGGCLTSVWAESTSTRYARHADVEALEVPTRRWNEGKGIRIQ